MAGQRREKRRICSRSRAKDHVGEPDALGCGAPGWYGRNAGTPRNACGEIPESGAGQTCIRRGKRKPMAPVGQLVRQLAQCQHSSPWATSGRSLPFGRCRSSST